MNPLGALLAQMVGAKKYTPKFCRVRGCNLKHGHKEQHSVPIGKPGPARRPGPPKVTPPREQQMRRNSTRASRRRRDRAASRGGA